MELKKTAIIINGFVHDFAAGIWLATIVTIPLLHRAHLREPVVTTVLNVLERQFFWASIVAVVFIMATGAGRTFTYVDNWYGENTEQMRRKALVIKHVILFACYGIGYFWVWDKVFHG